MTSTDGDPPQPPARRPRSAEEIAEQLANARTVLALFGFVLYAVLRIAYGQFYEPFGLSPDDLGLGYLEVLAQSAIGALVLLALFTLLVTFGVAIYVETVARMIDDLRSPIGRARRFVAGRGRSRPAPAPAPAPPADGAQDEREPAGADHDLVIGTIVFVSLAVLALLEWLTDLPAWEYGFPAVLIAGMTAAIGVLTVRGAARIRRGLAGELTLRGRPAVHWWRRGLALAALAIVLQAGATLITGANGDADAVREGRAVHSTFLGVRLTSWGAEAATLVWTADTIDPALRPLAQACLMYLGQSDGTLFVYSPHTTGRATYRLPASMAAVRIVPGARCRRGSRIPVP